MWGKENDVVFFQSGVANDKFDHVFNKSAFDGRINEAPPTVVFTFVDVDMSDSDMAGRITVDFSEVGDVGPDGVVLKKQSPEGVVMERMVAPR